MILTESILSISVISGLLYGFYMYMELQKNSCDMILPQESGDEFAVVISLPAAASAASEAAAGESTAATETAAGIAAV